MGTGTPALCWEWGWDQHGFGEQHVEKDGPESIILTRRGAPALAASPWPALDPHRSDEDVRMKMLLLGEALLPPQPQPWLSHCCPLLATSRPAPMGAPSWVTGGAQPHLPLSSCCQKVLLWGTGPFIAPLSLPWRRPLAVKLLRAPSLPVAT